MTWPSWHLKHLTAFTISTNESGQEFPPPNDLLAPVISCCLLLGLV